jgi:hypothetical protein
MQLGVGVKRCHFSVAFVAEGIIAVRGWPGSNDPMTQRELQSLLLPRVVGNRGTQPTQPRLSVKLTCKLQPKPLL